MKTKRITASAVLAAAALIIFAVEAQLPPLVPIPGIKLGLANVITVFALYYLGAPAAAAILAVRIVLGSVLLGQVGAMLYSAAGGLLAFAVSALLKRAFPPERLWVVSVFGAMAHNVGQMAAAVAVTATPALLWYLPALLISGIVTGAFTGLCAQFVYRRIGLKKM